MKPLFNPTYIIAFGGLCFAIAYIDSLSVRNYNYQNWFSTLDLIGKAGVVGFFVALAWLIISTVIKNK